VDNNLRPGPWATSDRINNIMIGTWSVGIPDIVKNLSNVDLVDNVELQNVVTIGSAEARSFHCPSSEPKLPNHLATKQASGTCDERCLTGHFV